MMIFGWIKRKFQLARIRGAQEDLDRFVLGLRGAADDELGTMLVVAAWMRCDLERTGLDLKRALGEGVPYSAEEMWKIQWNLAAIIRFQQKNGKQFLAAGVMIWLHSIRAMNIPEVRFAARQMWCELRRGSEYTIDAVVNFRTGLGLEIPFWTIEEAEYFPESLS